MNLQSPLKVLCVVFLLLPTACVVNPTAARPDSSSLKLPDFEDLLPDAGDSGGLKPDTALNTPTLPKTGTFMATLNSYGIRLSSLELNALKKLITVKPTGKWSRTRTQSAEQSLNSNYKRFASLFEPVPADADEYQKRAITFAEKLTVPYYLDLQYYLDSGQFLVIRWSEKTGEFIGIQPDGAVINYLISTAVKPPRYLKIDL